MSFAQLQQTVKEEAGRQATLVRGRYKKELARETTRIKELAQAADEVIIVQAQEEGGQQARRLHQEAQLKAKAGILRAKQQELDATRSQVIKEILSRDDVQTKALLAALGALLPDEQGSLTAGAQHEQQVKALAASKGLTVRNETIVNEGGFIYHGQKADINLTISHLVTQLFTRQRSEIAKILFD